MATKRMFTKDIVGSDAFLDMPTSSQLLYFHLGMEADDDGFIGNPKKVSRFIGASDDDLKILISKKFLLLFPSGVVVVKHHRMNNNWDKYNCKRTVYLEEFEQLFIKDNKSYTLDNTQGIPLQTENRLKPVFRIEENRIDKNRIEEKKDTSVVFYKKAEYLKAIPEVDIKEWTTRFDASPKDIRNKAESLLLYCESKGKRYANYKSFLLNALKRDFKERPKVVEKAPEPEMTPEQRRQVKEHLESIRSKMTLS